ncbi:MAG: hypothetical protein ACTSSI_14515 [Candidatus Helarchaeota archaeon]
MEYEWNFSFGRVRLLPEELHVIDPSIKFNELEKEYGDALRVLGKEAHGILKKTWKKGKTEVKEFRSFVAKDELKICFERIAEQEGVTATERSSTTSYGVGDAGASSSSESYEARAATTEEEEAVESKYLVKVDETVDYKINHENEVLESSVIGSLLIENQGTSNRIWDIDLKLSGGDTTDLDATDYHILELDPEEKWEQAYKINVETATPPLQITESIDTFPDTEEDSTTFILDKEKLSDCFFTIKLENTGDKTINDVEVVKTLSEDFESVKILEKTGDVDTESDKITWKLDEIGPNETVELSFKAEVKADEVKIIDSGEINAKYVLSEGTFSGLNIDFIDGLSKNIYYIDRDERDEEPDVWDCTFIFENRSEFPFRIQKVELKSGDYNTEEKTFAVEPNVIVNPGKEWVSEAWNLESEDLPTFGENVLFTIEPNIVMQLSASTTITSVPMMVLSLEGIKEFSKTQIPSYRKTELEVNIDVKTTGKAGQGAD